MFFDYKFSKSSDFYYLEPGLYPYITDIVEAKKNLFQESTITTKTESLLKCHEERKKLRFTLRIKDLVFQSLVRIWDRLSEVMLVLNLE